MKLFRVECNGLGVYAAVEKDCPRDDTRRSKKPDGSWLPRVGKNYPGKISYWTEFGFKLYKESGLMDWHDSVTEKPLTVTEIESKSLNIDYLDEYQVIGSLK